MAKDSTQKAKPAQKKIYDPKANELRRQVDLSFERLMCQASGPKELKELEKETGRLILRQKDYDKVIKMYKKRAKQGDADAQYNLGYMYENGEGVEGDYVIAAEWYEKAAGQGHAKAQNNLAFLYRKGYGVPQDMAKAVELYEKAAGQGCAIAQINLGYLYKYGTETGQDYVKAAEYFSKAAAQGNPTGQVNLAELYDEGKGVSRDYAEAAKWYLKAAEQGIKPAAKRLGEMYEKGLGVPQDPAKAEYWSKEGIIRRSWIFNWGTSIKRGSQCGRLKKVIEKVTDPELKDSLVKIKDKYWNKIEQLNKPDFTNEDKEQIWQEQERMEKFTGKMENLLKAEQGDADAQNELGVMYFEGKDMEQDYGKAAKWFLKAAGQGHANAQRYLGFMHYHGKGVAQDYEKAAEYWKKAAGQGDAVAQFNSGYIYDSGEGVEQDYAKAAEWYKKAAAQGHKRAQYNLAAMYEAGEGVEQDYGKAAEWFEKSAEQGYVTAQGKLATMYDKGTGVPQDFAKAAKWYEKAAEQGNYNSQFILATRYYDGQGVPQDYSKAAEWYKAGAVQGHMEAQYQLAYMYYRGKGVPQDYGKAIEWNEKAAEQGYVGAQFALGTIYYEGGGIPRDYAKAAEWFEKAAEQGDGEAMNKLREIYEKTKPARYVLMCDYPGLWFRTFIDASKLGFSFTDDHAYYVRSLEDVIGRVLEEQVRKAIYDLYFPEDDIQPAGRFDYYDVEKIINSRIPYNENVEASLITIGKDGKIIETKTFKILEFLDNDPDYFREYGVSEAVYQYISTALKRFENEAVWHYALKKENGVIEKAGQWPSPQKDGSWIDADGTVLQPYVWFGVNGNGPENLWSLHGNMSEDDVAFWFSEDPLEYIIENDEEIYSFFRGQAPKEEIDRPDMENILRKCPVSIDEDDTPGSIKEKIQEFFLEQYRKG